MNPSGHSANLAHRMALAGMAALLAAGEGSAAGTAPPVPDAAPGKPAIVAARPLPPEFGLLADERFPPPSVRVDAGDIFALDAAMKAYLREQVEPKVAVKGRQHALIGALYTKNELKLTYDSTLTRSASQAFEDRAGNCLSLVIMTAAFAKALDLEVNYNRVLVDEAIGREGDIYLAIGHINLTLGPRTGNTMKSRFQAGTRYIEPERMTVDFLRPEDMRTVRTLPLEEATVVAMYLNNRAVEALALGSVVDAYWWAREAVLNDHDCRPAVNTLGVVYERHRDAAEAERTLRHVLARDAGNTLAMSNLVSVLAETGRIDESRALAAKLVKLDPEPPFSWFLRGREALRAGDLETAKDAFAREVARAPDFHEFHFWLAMAHFGLREDAAAHAELERAVETSTTPRDRDRYASKLAALAGGSRVTR